MKATAKAIKIILNKKQKGTYDLAMKRENLFIGGGGGVGKSTLLKEIIRDLKELYGSEKVLVTAPTGIATSHIGGVTLAKAFSLMGNYDNVVKYIKGRLKPIEVLIIDEVSMASRYSIDKIDLRLKLIKGVNKPFGGVQVIFVGDFLQLPPIEKNAPDKLIYPFLSDAWGKSIKICYLTEKIRQDKTDPLVTILDALRDGTVNDETVKLLENQFGEFKEGMSSLLPTNAEVDGVNSHMLNSLKGEAKTFRFDSKNLSENEIKEIEKNSLVSPTLQLKVGAIVLFIKNDVEGKWVNGSIGTILKINKHKILVDIKGCKTYVDRENFYIDNRTPKQKANDTKVRGYYQYPIKLGWAITIHKSQGMTLDGKVFIDLSRTFTANQMYVALSRLTRLANLILGGLGQQSFLMDAYIRDHIEPRLKKGSVV